MITDNLQKTKKGIDKREEKEYIRGLFDRKKGLTKKESRIK